MYVIGGVSLNLNRKYFFEEVRIKSNSLTSPVTDFFVRPFLSQRKVYSKTLSFFFFLHKPFIIYPSFLFYIYSFSFLKTYTCTYLICIVTYYFPFLWNLKNLLIHCHKTLFKDLRPAISLICLINRERGWGPQDTGSWERGAWHERDVERNRAGQAGKERSGNKKFFVVR